MKFYFRAFLTVGIVGSMAGCSSQPGAPVANGYNYYGKTQQKQYTYNYAAPTATALSSELDNTYTVQTGDTLVKLARHFGTSVEAIQNKNDLTSTQIRPGEVLLIPQVEEKRYSLTRREIVRSNETLSVQDEPVKMLTIEKAGAQKQEPITKKVASYTTHTVKGGENLYRIGLHYKASTQEIMKLNGMKKNTLYVGQKLKIPGDGKTYTASTKPVQKVATNTVKKKAVTKAKSYPSSAPRYANVNTTRRGFIWPAEGKIIRKFGSESAGVSNSGINIALAPNSPIVAAEDGVVIYSDNGLRSYGNMILVRHKSGVVTGYAHNSKNMVKKNERVSKGQVIALAGNTGDVKTSQLHFEVRKNSRPVNPTKILP